MKCPYCGEEMIRGYLMSSRDITFAVDNVTKVFRIKQSDDLELSKGSGGIPHCEAYRCSSCKKILIDYANSSIPIFETEKSGFVELVNLDFGKYKNVSHYGFNAVCKEKQYDWVCYMVTFGSVYNWIRNKRYVF